MCARSGSMRAPKGCPASLADVWGFQTGRVMSKEVRNMFVKDEIGTIARSFQRLMSYCAQDVEATHEV